MMPETTISPSHSRCQRARARISVRMSVWLVVVWVILRGDLTLVGFLVGLCLALAVQLLLPMPHLGIIQRVRPLWVAVLLGRFVVDMVVAALQVSWLVLRRRPPTSRIVTVELRSQSALFLTIGSGLTSLVPGTVVVDAHLRPATLHLHVLDIDLAGGPDGVRRTQLRLEERIMRAFASRKELTARGIAPVERHTDTAVAGQE